MIEPHDVFRIFMTSMPPERSYEFRFFPVGQGLFSAGRLVSAGKAPFVWAYDCGTASSQWLLAAALRGFDAWHPAPAPLGLVALSHFDRDHVNGACDLMRGRRVEVLLLPYVGFSERLLLAFDAGVEPGDPFFEFFVDPAAYVLSRDVDPDRILYVPPAGDATAGAGEADGTAVREALGDYLVYEPGPAPTDEGPDRPAGAAGGRGAWLRPGGSISHRDYGWEFVPYNDAVPRRRRIDLAKVERFVRCRDEASLDQLRRAYDRAFGRSASARNAISLFLYAGPAARRPAPSAPGMRPVPIRLPSLLVEGRPPGIRLVEHGATGWLATGDGYLDTPQRLDRLVAYLGPARVARVQVLQVMHHGAKANWHPGVAARIAPAVSIFSSDPGHRGFRHPHPPVLADFLPYGPCQVDRTAGCMVIGPLPA